MLLNKFKLFQYLNILRLCILVLQTHVRATAALALAAGDLVDLVKEDDAVVLGALERVAVDAILIDELAALVLLEQPQRVGGLEPVLARAVAEAGHVLEQVLQVHADLFHTLA